MKLHLGGAWRWARRRLHDVAVVGGAVVEALGIKKGTAVGKVVEGARRGDDVVSSVEGAISGGEPPKKTLDKESG